LREVADALLAETRAVADTIHRDRELACAKVAAVARAATQLVLLGEHEHARPFFDQLVRAEHDRDGLLDGAAEARIATARYYEALDCGDLGAATEHARRAVVACERVGDRRGACTHRGEVGWALVELGAHVEAIETLRAVLEDAAALGHLHYPTAAALQNLGVALARIGRLEEARSAEEEAIELLRGDPRMEGEARAILAEILVASGDLDRAAAQLGRAHELPLPLPIRVQVMATAAQLWRLRGDHARALEEARRSVNLLADGRDVPSEARARLVLVELLAERGLAEDAATALQMAHDRLQARAARITDRDARARYLADVPENVRILELGRELLE
jgi:tetratricopeptide (TPR) repeat protein